MFVGCGVVGAVVASIHGGVGGCWQSDMALEFAGALTMKCQSCQGVLLGYMRYGCVGIGGCVLEC